MRIARALGSLPRPSARTSLSKITTPSGAIDRKVSTAIEEGNADSSNLVPNGLIV